VTAYREPGQPGRGNRRRAVLFQARRVRNALVRSAILANSGQKPEVSTLEILETLTACIEELDDSASGEPFA